MHGVSIVRSRRNTCGALAIASLLTLHPLAALADDAPDLLTEPFNVALGTFIMDNDTQLRLDGESGRGTNVDWENTFGGGESTRFRVDGSWRFGDSEKHKLRALWFNYSRTKTRNIDREIEWGDNVFPIDTRLKAKLDFDIYELAYEYAFLRRENYEVGASIGLHYAKFAAALSRETADTTETVRREASVDAPLPVIGLRALWGLPYDLWIDAGAQYFALSIDEYDGSLRDYKIVLNWQPRKWLGVGIGYNQFDVDVDVDKDTFRGALDWTYRGPMIFYSAAF